MDAYVACWASRRLPDEYGQIVAGVKLPLSRQCNYGNVSAYNLVCGQGPEMTASTDSVIKYFNSTTPLGPTAAPPISSDREIQRFIFDHDNALFKELNHGKTLIVGRKGSGKTSMLNTAYFDEEKGTVIIPLDSNDSADIFMRIVQEIEALSRDVTLVEQVSKLWEVLIWGVVFRVLSDKFKDEVIEQYIRGLDILDLVGTPYQYIDKQLEVMKGFPPPAHPLPQKIRYTKINGLTFIDVKSYAVSLLKKKKMLIYVLMDSFEDYKLHIYENSASLAGLLRCIGDFTAERSPCILRCCVPAEKYHVLMSLSQNPLKDFAGSMLLHWDAGELIQLSAKRYAIYLKYHEQLFYSKEVDSLDLNSRDGAFKFWERIFPKVITNRNGVVENPIPYIMRHTQLLPRHFLFILNNILSQSIKVHGRFANISQSDIVDGVYQSEDGITAQILQAYRSSGIAIESACSQILKELRTHFEWSDFDRVVASRSGELRDLGRGEVMQLLIGASFRITCTR